MVLLPGRISEIESSNPMVNAGIFGPKLSGKSTLAHRLSLEHFQRYQMKSLVLDPNTDDWPNWGQHSVITDDEEKFWPMVWASQYCVVFVEEAAGTINRDKSLIQVFTKLRHNNHKLVIIGHSGMSLLPIMREQIDTIYLFRQPNSSCKVWSEVMTNEKLFAAKDLNQYEFIYHRLYGPTVKMILPTPEAKPVAVETVKEPNAKEKQAVDL